MSFLKTGKVVGILFLIMNHSLAQERPSADLKIPLTLKKGYGPIWPWFAPVKWIDPKDSSDLLRGTYTALKGLPVNWSNLKIGLIKFDARQYAFQNVTSGNIAAQRDKKNSSNSNKKPSDGDLSRRPVRCYVYVAIGQDQGVTKMIIDANNNLDFSDDKPFQPEQFDIRKLDKLAKGAPIVSYERYCHGMIIKDQAPVLILHEQTDKGGSRFEYNIPQYAMASFEDGGEEYELAVSSYYFTSSTYINCQIAITQQIFSDKKVPPDSMITQGGIIRIHSNEYRNLGVDICSSTLLLKKLEDTTGIYSTQDGFKAPLFDGKDFLTGKLVSLNSFRGKYVLLDFWGTWCSPCRTEIPYLKEVYDKYSRKGLVILGIAVQDSPDSLRAFIQNNHIQWGQILSQQIADEYKIYSYPSNFLIDPNGKIIARNLRGLDLVKNINYLLH